MISASFKATQDRIFPRLGGGSPQRSLPDDAVLLRIADQFDVHFVAYLEDEKGVESEVVITKPQLKRWRVKLETLANTAGWNGGETAIWGWPPVNDKLRLFQYPDNDEYWISHIVSPGCLLGHTDVPNPPIVMIPNPTTIFIAGLPDHDAQALLLELSIKAAGDQPPVTCRPIVIDNNWEKWNLVPDVENPFAKEYQRHFGNVQPLFRLTTFVVGQDARTPYQSCLIPLNTESNQNPYNTAIPYPVHGVESMSGDSYRSAFRSLQKNDCRHNCFDGGSVEKEEMMKLLQLSLFLSVCLLFSERSSAQIEKYNPLEKSASRAQQPVEITMQDQKRKRDIPLRIFLPDLKQAAPVILFSHGLGGSRDGCSYLGKHWSNRGYVVVFLQHAGSDEAVWKTVARRERLKALRAAANVQNTLDRYQDVSAVLDQLARWNADAKHQFHKKFDMQRIGMSGHSHGAVTTQGVSGQSLPLVGKRYTDPRIKAAVMFSPSYRGRLDRKQSFGQVSIPWMTLTGTKDTSVINDTTVEDRRKVYRALPDSIDKYELVLSGAQHSAFTDGPERLGKPRRNPQHHPRILAVTTAFWDAYLHQNRDAGEWLQGKQCRELLDSEDQWQAQTPTKKTD